jgi:hypothetical protein
VREYRTARPSEPPLPLLREERAIHVPQAVSQ